MKETKKIAKHGLHQTTRRVLIAFDKLSRADNGISPTHRDLQAFCKIASTSTVKHHIETLIERGYLLNVKPGKSRALRLTVQGERWLNENVTKRTPALITTAARALA